LPDVRNNPATSEAAGLAAKSCTGAAAGLPAPHKKTPPRCRGGVPELASSSRFYA
jgi:hypothetical protein